MHLFIYIRLRVYVILITFVQINNLSRGRLIDKTATVHTHSSYKEDDSHLFRTNGMAFNRCTIHKTLLHQLCPQFRTQQQSEFTVLDFTFIGPRYVDGHAFIVHAHHIYYWPMTSANVMCSGVNVCAAQQ